jgi:hypothetical protein
VVIHFGNHAINNLIIGGASDDFGCLGAIAGTGIGRITDYRCPLSLFWTFITTDSVKDRFVVVNEIAELRSCPSATFPCVES